MPGHSKSLKFQVERQWMGRERLVGTHFLAFMSGFLHLEVDGARFLMKICYDTTHYYGNEAQMHQP